MDFRQLFYLLIRVALCMMGNGKTSSGVPAKDLLP